MEQKTDIFISYRRSDGRDIARTVQLALKSAGAGNVFFDYSSLRDGVFNEKIHQAIDECRVFVLILSPESLTRCAMKGDWVAIEINRARQAGCTIIPLAIDNNYDRWPSNLPENLHFLKSIQQTKLLTDEYFEESIARLVKRIEATPEKKPKEPAPRITPTPKNKSDALMEALIIHIEGCRNAINKNNSKALKLFRQGAQMGLGESLAMLGYIYEHGKFDVQQDLEKAFRYFQEAASNNSAPGWLGMSRMYRQGIGVSGSPEFLEEQAVNCIELAREWREKIDIKIDTTSMNPNSRLPVSEKFKWVITDKEQNILGRGTGNLVFSIFRCVKDRPGIFFISGFDGTTYRAGRVIK